MGGLSLSSGQGGCVRKDLAAPGKGGGHAGGVGGLHGSSAAGGLLCSGSSGSLALCQGGRGPWAGHVCCAVGTPVAVLLPGLVIEQGTRAMAASGLHGRTHSALLCCMLSQRRIVKEAAAARVLLTRCPGCCTVQLRLLGWSPSSLSVW